MWFAFPFSDLWTRKKLDWTQGNYLMTRKIQHSYRSTILNPGSQSWGLVHKITTTKIVSDFYDDSAISHLYVLLQSTRKNCLGVATLIISTTPVINCSQIHSSIYFTFTAQSGSFQFFNFSQYFQ